MIVLFKEGSSEEKNGGKIIVCKCVLIRIIVITQNCVDVFLNNSCEAWT